MGTRWLGNRAERKKFCFTLSCNSDIMMLCMMLSVLKSFFLFKQFFEVPPGDQNL